MPRKRRTGNLRYALLAIVIAMVLWGMARGGSTVEREYELPLVFDALPNDLVITDQTATKINVRVRGSRATFRNLSAAELEYVESVGGAKPGRARYEVDDDRLDLPRGLRVVGRSPSQIDVRFERRGRKSVRIRADVQGEPPEGFKVNSVEIEPARVWLTGARSRVLRLSEVVTETIDLSQIQAPEQREVRVSIGADHVWVEDNQPITVKIDVEPLEPVDGVASDEEGQQTG